MIVSRPAKMRRWCSPRHEPAPPDFARRACPQGRCGSGSAAGREVGGADGGEFVLAIDQVAVAERGDAADDEGQGQGLDGQVQHPRLDVLPEQEQPEQAGRQRVEDGEPGLRRVLERFLERHGYRVLSAGTAESAYEMLAAEEADALLLDIHLPTMSGLALYLAIIHRWPALEGHIAIMTGDAEAEEVRTWLDHHHCTVIRKPFNLQQVSDWVASVLQSDRASGAMDA